MSYALHGAMDSTFYARREDKVFTTPVIGNVDWSQFDNLDRKLLVGDLEKTVARWKKPRATRSIKQREYR